MSRTAPRIFGKAHSIRVDLRGKKLDLLRTAGRATQLVRKVFSERAMIWAELLNQPVDIKTFTVVAPVAVSGQQIPVSLEITQRSDRSRSIHDSLQGWLSYTANNQRTNHIFNQRRSK